MTTRAAVFQALAAGHDLQEVQDRFQLTPAQLQELFQEVADHFRDLEEGVWSLYCDGASRGNPGQAGAGVVLVDACGDIRVQYGEYLGQTTNNVAEYQALILGLNMALNLGVKKIQVFADSELLVRQLKGRYQVKAAHLRPLYEAATAALKEFESSGISHVPRAENYLADRQANRAIDRKLGVG
ncbi:MAG: ribonuclease HI family protein [Deltaproteobacteria bacterium]